MIGRRATTSARASGGRLRLFLGIGVAAASGLAAAFSLAAATARSPAESMAQVTTLLDEARAESSRTFARDEFDRAEASWQQAYRALRLAEVRLLGFLAYDEVDRLVARAGDDVRIAIEHGRQRRQQERTRALDELDAVELRIDSASGALPAVPFGASLRAGMTRAGIALAEARARYERGDFTGAADRAAAAREGFDRHLKQVDEYLADDRLGLSARRDAVWVEDTLRESRRSGGSAIIVEKSRRRCLLYRAGRLVRSYGADLGPRPAARKVKAGDLATPEGRYRVRRKRGRGETRYHKALLLDYPNAEDRIRFEQALRRGWIPAGSEIGGLIEIHGNGGRREDWTEGCVALSNRDMDHLFSRVRVGTPVTIVAALPEI